MVGQEFLLLPLENEVLRAKPPSGLPLLPSPPMRGVNDCYVCGGTIMGWPTSHSPAGEVGPGGQVRAMWSHLLWSQLNG